MPIYAYRCDTCGFQQDVLQKMSDARLTVCPSCGSATFQKQVTAAGFQLKGSGWYVTDFRNPAAKTGTKPDGAANGGDATAESKGDSAAPKTDASTPAAAPAPAPAAADPKPAPAPVKSAPGGSD